MRRVKKEIKDAAIKAVKELDDSVKDKCGLCNITLTDAVKKVEAKTKASMYMVCKLIAEEINKGRPEVEHISPKALHERIRRTEGKVDNKKRAKKVNKNQSNEIKKPLPRCKTMRPMYEMVNPSKHERECIFLIEEANQVIDQFIELKKSNDLLSKTLIAADKEIQELKGKKAPLTFEEDRALFLSEARDEKIERIKGTIEMLNEQEEKDGKELVIANLERTLEKLERDKNNECK